MKGRTAGYALLGAGVAGILGVEYVQRFEPWLRHWGATEAESSATCRSTTWWSRARTHHARHHGARAGRRRLALAGPDRPGPGRVLQLHLAREPRRCRDAQRDAVHPDWQERRSGDTVWLADQDRWGGRGRQVAALVDPPHALVLVSPDDWGRLQHGQRRPRRGLLPGTRRRAPDPLPDPKLRWRGRHPRLRRDPLPDGAEDDARPARPRRSGGRHPR